MVNWHPVAEPFGIQTGRSRSDFHYYVFFQLKLESSSIRLGNGVERWESQTRPTKISDLTNISLSKMLDKFPKKFQQDTWYLKSSFHAKFHLDYVAANMDQSSKAFRLCTSFERLSASPLCSVLESLQNLYRFVQLREKDGCFHAELAAGITVSQPGDWYRSNPNCQPRIEIRGICI